MDYPEHKIRSAVKKVLSLLSTHQYQALADLTAAGSNRLDPEEIKKTLEDYPGTIRMPSDSELAFDAVEVEGSSPRQFSVDAPVFTVEEGGSDLTARMVVIDKPDDGIEVVFYDVWVM